MLKDEYRIRLTPCIYYLDFAQVDGMLYLHMVDL